MVAAEASKTASDKRLVADDDMTSSPPGFSQAYAWS
jgi:hypothetical protein